MSAELLYILAATILSTLLSISIAAFLSLAWLSKMVERMISFSVGIMLSTAFLHALPEAFESEADFHSLSTTLLIGLVAFFFLEKVTILQHSHHHEINPDSQPCCAHEHHHSRSGMMVLIGDALHNFTDGILIAAAFLADFHLGLMTSATIFIHEIPQEIGDFFVLLHSGYSKKRAYVYNLLSGFSSVLGGIIGYFALAKMESLIPYVITIASSSFIYIAVCDLMPQMKRSATVRESAIQIFLVLLGIGVVYFLTHGLHHHHH